MKRAIAVAAVAVAVLLGGCTDGRDPQVATAGGTDLSPAASPSRNADPLAQELEFVACMRAEGIDDMPDPVPGDTSGRSAVRYAIDVLGKGSDMTFQAALDKCVGLLPEPPEIEPPSADDLAGFQRFARCMRDNGVPEFPDPKPDGDLGVIFLQTDPGDEIQDVARVGEHLIVNISHPTVAAAFETCKNQLPNNDD